jgi:hypothetical protein
MFLCIQLLTRNLYVNFPFTWLRNSLHINYSNLTNQSAAVESILENVPFPREEREGNFFIRKVWLVPPQDIVSHRETVLRDCLQGIIERMTIEIVNKERFAEDYWRFSGKRLFQRSRTETI